MFNRIVLFVGLLFSSAWAWGDVIKIRVHVPGYYDSILIGGSQTKTVGYSRLFESPELSPGNYFYTFQVTHQGKTRTIKRSFPTGQTTVLTFSSEDFKTIHVGGYSYRPITDSDLSRSRQQLRSAYQTLDPMIERSESRDYWVRTLKWDELKKELNSESPSVAQLDQIYQQFFQDKKGMAYRQVISVRKAIKKYRDNAYFLTIKNPERVFRQKMSSLNKLLKHYDQTRSSETRLAIGEIVGWLDSAGQVPDLISEIHRKYSKSTSISQVSERLFTGLVKKNISTSTPVRDVIMGSPVSGVSHVWGRTYLKFVPNSQNGQIQVGMSGTMSSDTTSYGGQGKVSVAVRSHVENSVHVYKNAFVSSMGQDGIQVSSAQAHVTPIPGRSHSNINVHSAHRLRFIRRIATRKAYGIAASRIPQGRAIARYKAAVKLASEANNQKMSEGMKKSMAQLNKLYDELYRLPQVRTGVFSQYSGIRTTDDWLVSHHVRRRADELGAPNEPPAFRLSTHDIAIRAHESEFTNLLNFQWEGRRLHDDFVMSMLNNLEHYVPRPFRLGSHMPRFSFRFVSHKPISLELGDDKLTIRLSFQSTRIGPHTKAGTELKDYDVGVKAVATYALKRSKQNSLYFERQGEVDIQADERNAVVEKVLMPFWKAKLGALLGESYHLDGLTAVPGGPFEPLTKFRLDEFRSEQGWIVFGWRYTGDPNELFNGKLGDKIQK